MAEQHRATADEWACVKEYNSEISFSCILELRDRIKALETRNEDDKEAWAAMRRAGSSAADRIGALEKRIEALEVAVNRAASEAYRAASTEIRPSEVAERIRAAAGMRPNHPAKPNSSLERRVSEHIKAQSVLTAALVKRLEALEGVPLDGAVPAKVPGGLPALAEKVKALEDTVNATTQPNYLEKPDSSLVERVAAAITGDSVYGPINWKPEARAAIREIAAWLGEQKSYGHGWAAITLEQEAK
jgi:hypothetical protein